MGSITNQNQTTFMPFNERILEGVNEIFLENDDRDSTGDLPCHEAATVQDLENACFRLVLTFIGYGTYWTRNT
jgi:hypothetical protein